MTFEDFKGLSLKTVGSWPIMPKLGALLVLLLVIVGAAYWFDWQNQLIELETAEYKEAELRTKFMDRKKLAVNLDAYRLQLAEIERSFGALLKQLPSKSEMEALLTDINQAGLGRGLQFELFRPATQESVSEFYAELPIAIRVTGSYHDIGAFASDIAQLSRIVTLNDMNISGGKDGLLAMDAVAKTYRYLDEEEVSKQKRAAKDKAAKK
ncbi:MAG: type 4a pilus biogenesis protein PilO [Burkholderiales bacterium]|nr:type 4a pilus biogenesis protein PilO [Burkholderiales bacterium]